MLSVNEVTDLDELPSNATKGFTLVDEDDGTLVAFFHWNDDPQTTPGAPLPDDAPEGMPAPPDVVVPHNPYENVRAALPLRLAQLGYDDETDDVEAAVDALFGSVKVSLLDTAREALGLD